MTEEGVVLFDTPWDSTQCAPLLDSIRLRHNKDVVLCIATHAHADRTGGLEFLAKKGIRTYASAQTDDYCKLNGEKRARFLFENDTVFTVGQYTFRTYYPGEGHTPDNIVIWFEKEQILYGGCLIKSTEAAGLGNIAEANLDAWPGTIRNLKRRFGRPRYIIPGHLDWQDNRSLDHTLKLLKKAIP